MIYPLSSIMMVNASGIDTVSYIAIMIDLHGYCSVVNAGFIITTFCTVRTIDPQSSTAKASVGINMDNNTVITIYPHPSV
jgi:hypothetical protein